MQADDILDEFKITYARSGQHHHAREGWVQIRNCPFCSSDNYHLGLNLAGRYCVCWRCGGHSLWSVLAAYGVPVKQIKVVLGDLSPVLNKNSVAAPSRRLKEPSGRTPLSAIFKEYLAERGFEPKTIQDLWQLEAIGLQSRLAWRIYIPIHFRGARVSWTTRAIGKRVAQRYISASSAEESIPHKEIVYGLDFCHDRIVIVEGPTDVWRIGPGSGALFGTAFTPAQVLLLSNIPNRFVCFDNEPQAQSKARGLCEHLAVFPGRTENIVLDAKDPGSASKSEIATLKRAIGLV